MNEKHISKKSLQNFIINFSFFFIFPPLSLKFFRSLCSFLDKSDSSSSAILARYLYPTYIPHIHENFESCWFFTMLFFAFASLYTWLLEILLLNAMLNRFYVVSYLILFVPIKSYGLSVADSSPLRLLTKFVECNVCVTKRSIDMHVWK